MTTMTTLLSLVLVGLAVSLSAVAGASLHKSPCEPGWECFHERCYKYFPFPKSWADSEVHCVSLGGSLASVHNSYANHFVTNLIKSQDSTGPVTWLGGSNCQQISTWLWTDGTKWDFSFWNPGEPNNAYKKEKCLEINYKGNPCFLCAE
ncbi:lectin-like [Polypterus senegalus]|uniref:lectin-like n=1 Tax=Polypterus senegalus TaxID=55291 RepID=UPI0019655877|nr:lectin-like [Polypterus senegalus]